MYDQTRLKRNRILFSILGVFVFVSVPNYLWADELQKLNDTEITKLTSGKGTVVLNFWATWCEPCVEEIPIFIRLQKNRSDLKVVGISLDELNQEAMVREFIKKHKMNYKIALRQGENFETMVNSIDPSWMGGLPATFVFKDGKRIFSKTGLIREKELGNAVK